MRRSLLLVVLLAGACYTTSPASPGFHCRADDVPACPEGQSCVAGRCVSGELDLGMALPDIGPLPDMAGPSDGGVMPGGCDGVTTCAAPTVLGNLNADTGGTLTATGGKAEWLRVQTIEANSDIFGQRMRLRVTLTSPSATNFDLYVYRGGLTTAECSTVSGSSTSTSGTDVVSLDWGESDSDLANGVDDDAVISIEVRPAAGATCSAGQTWSLEVRGGL